VKVARAILLVVVPKVVGAAVQLDDQSLTNKGIDVTDASDPDLDPDPDSFAADVETGESLKSGLRPAICVGRYLGLGRRKVADELL